MEKELDGDDDEQEPSSSRYNTRKRKVSNYAKLAEPRYSLLDNLSN